MNILKEEARTALQCFSVLISCPPKNKDVYWSHARTVQAFLAKATQDFPGKTKTKTRK